MKTALILFILSLAACLSLFIAGIFFLLGFAWSLLAGSISCFLISFLLLRGLNSDG